MSPYGSNEYFNAIEGNGRQPQHIRGIVCDVRNCAYHDGDSYCTANRIRVGPLSANRSGETACATFRPRNI